MWLEGQKYFQATLKEEPIYNVQIEILNKTKKWLDYYFNGEKPNINRLLLKPQGSKFRKEIWKILCEIPYGEVTTYGKIADEVAKNARIDFGLAKWGSVGSQNIPATYVFEKPKDLLRIV
ncbi:MGMT family protein [Faecalibacillus intestinalis]|uniref:MGMT family protein n=1 Tax=Faecalibacillus intestinalis TaxID=1982626 RepID=UPI00131417B7|nr:MGMT family protein [Faecalibacillus intestinalis]